MDDALKIMELASYVATVLGIPVGLLIFWNEKRKDRKNQEIEIYLRSCDCYLNYLEKVLEHPSTGCGSFRGDETQLKEVGLTVEQITLYEILIITLEQAHFLYGKSNFTVGNVNWQTWVEYIQWLATRRDFQQAWEIIDPIIDPEFRNLVQDSINAAKNIAPIAT